MQHRLIIATIFPSPVTWDTSRFNGVQNALRGLADDYLQLSSTTYILWTDQQLFICQEVIGGKLVAGTDQFFVAELVPSALAGGVLPKWAWAWLNQRPYQPDPRTPFVPTEVQTLSSAPGTWAIPRLSNT